MFIYDTFIYFSIIILNIILKLNTTGIELYLTNFEILLFGNKYWNITIW